MSGRQRLQSQPNPLPAHTSVMMGEVAHHLEPKAGDFVVDATAGMGGHAEALLKAAPISLLALDADPAAVAATALRLKHFGERAKVVEANFRDLEHVPPRGENKND